MVARFIAGSLLLLALLVLPFVLPQHNASEAASPEEVVSLRKPAAAARAPVAAPAGMRPLSEALASADLREVWVAAAVLAATRMETPPAARDRLVGAFLEGRMDFAASFARAALASMPEGEAATFADRAPNLDRSLVLMKSAPPAVLRRFVRRCEDPAAHVEAARALSAQIRGLVPDPGLGRRAYGLLAAAGIVSEDVIEALSHRVSSDEWARAELAGLGSAALGPLGRRMASPDPAVRAAATWLVALAEGEASADRIIKVAVDGLRSDDVPDNARFGVRALSALGPRARPVAGVLLRSSDDQVVACALDVLMRTGGASAEQIAAARPALSRLAIEAADEAAIAAELRRALGEAPGARDVPAPPEALKPGQVRTAGSGN